MWAGTKEQATMLVSYHCDFLDEDMEITICGLPKGGCEISVYLTDEGHDDELVYRVECDEETYALPIIMVDEQIRLIQIRAK